MAVIKYPQLQDRDWLYQKYWEERLTNYEIADELGCAPCHVHRHMKRLNIPMRQAMRRVGLYSRYPQLYDKHWLNKHYVEEQQNGPEIAKSLGCTIPIIYDALERVGIERRNIASYRVGEYKYPELHDKDWLVQKHITETLNTKDIAAILGCGHSTVAHALKIFDIPISLKYKHRKLDDKDFLWQRYIVERKSMGDIASEVGCSRSNIYTSLKCFEIPMRTVKEATNEEGSRRKKSEISKELWQSEEYIKNIFAGRYLHPNKFESHIDTVLQHFIPHEWAYNGGFECGITIGGLVPDFVNINGRKQLIEGFGDPFHDGTFNCSWKRTEFGRKAIFAQLGYDVLILWQSVIDKMADEEIAEVVIEFMEAKTKAKSKKRKKKPKK